MYRIARIYLVFAHLTHSITAYAVPWVNSCPKAPTASGRPLLCALSSHLWGKSESLMGCFNIYQHLHWVYFSFERRTQGTQAP